MRGGCFLLFMVCAAGVASCGASLMAPDPAHADVPVVRLRSEPISFTFNSGLTEPERLVLRDRSAWAEVWTRIWRGRSPVPELPAVDFAREMVVVVALGQRPTGGYGILVESADADADTLRVRVSTISPGPRCVVTQALTEPVDIARLPRREGPVQFEDRPEVRDCQ